MDTLSNGPAKWESKSEILFSKQPENYGRNAGTKVDGWITFGEIIILTRYVKQLCVDLTEFLVSL